MTKRKNESSSDSEKPSKRMRASSPTRDDTSAYKPSPSTYGPIQTSDEPSPTTDDPTQTTDDPTQATHDPTQAADETFVPIKPAFFNHLNYDVRTQIYSYMDLPPLATDNGQEWSGFALSCKQAHVELTEAAALQTKVFLTTFKKEYKQNTGFDLDISGIDAINGMRGLKEITVSAPTTLLQEYVKKPEIYHRRILDPAEDPDFRSDTRIARLKPLLEKRFDKVTILLRSSPTPTIEGDEVDREEEMRQLMERAEIAIQTIIISMNDALLTSQRAVFDPPKNPIESTNRIQTKRIGIAWDLDIHTDEASKNQETDKSLKGRRMRYSEILRAMLLRDYEYMQSGVLIDDPVWMQQYEKIDNDSDWPSSYHLLSANKSRGEFGLESNRGWKTQIEVCDLYSLWSKNGREEMLIRSDELGGNLVDDGLPRETIWTDEVYAPSFI